MRRRYTPARDVLGIAGQDDCISIEGDGSDVAVHDVACPWCRRGEHADAAARFRVECQLGDQVAREQTRQPRLSVSPSPDLSHDRCAGRERDVAAIGEQDVSPDGYRAALDRDEGSRAGVAVPRAVAPGVWRSGRARFPGDQPHVGRARGFVLYWLVPLAFWMPVLNAFRTMAEHMAIPGALDGGSDGSGTRTTLAGWAGKTLLFAHNINDHVEHHFYPSVPFHRLPELHALLQESLRHGATPPYHVTRGYGAVWRELVGARS